MTVAELNDAINDPEDVDEERDHVPEMDAEGWINQAIEGGMADDDSDAGDWEDPSGGCLGELIEACENGETAAVPGLLERLFETGVSIDTMGGEGDTALHNACLYGHTEIVKLLLNKGASAGILDENGGTPLHDAAAGGFVEICESLLAVHAEQGLQNVQDEDGDSPLHNAARGNHGQIVAMLLEAGASATLANQAGHLPADVCNKNTALHTLLLRAAGGDPSSA
jgi:ankyrin repeat protein